MVPAVEFGRITGQADRVLIVATGPSAVGLHIRRHAFPDVHIIAVKQAIRAVEAHDWVTVDPNERARMMMRNQVAGVRYIAAVPDDYGTARPRILAHRGPPEPNVLYIRRLTGDGPLKSRYQLSEDRGGLHTGNSAWGALGVAYLLQPKKIAFVGLDGSQAPHGIGSGAPRGSLAHLPDLFASAIPQLNKWQIEVRNGSPESRIECFPRVERSAALRWLLQ